MAKTKTARPGTGVTRKTKQPVRIDRLPTSVQADILYLRNVKGKTWQEIEAMSAEKYSSSWKSSGGGFIDWTKLSADVLRLFPGKRLPKSNLHRWWDLRVAQVQANVERMALQAREIGEVFARGVHANDKNAVVGAARDILLGILAEDGSVGGRASVAGALIELAAVMETGIANEIRERTVAMTERKVAALEKREAAAQKKLEAETSKLRKKASKGAVTSEDMERLYESVFGPRPKAAA